MTIERFFIFLYNSVVGRLLFIVTHLSPGWVEFRIKFASKIRYVLYILDDYIWSWSEPKSFSFDLIVVVIFRTSIFLSFLLHARIFEISQMLKRICTTHSLIHTKTLQQYIQIEYFFIDVVFPAGIHTRADWWHRMCVVGWMNVERPPFHTRGEEREKEENRKNESSTGGC